MYYILVYDIQEKRVVKMLKLCRQYLNWVQNSVFEGELTEMKLEELKKKILMIVDPEYDSVMIYGMNHKWLIKETIGLEKSPTDNFL